MRQRRPSFPVLPYEFPLLLYDFPVLLYVKGCAVCNRQKKGCRDSSLSRVARGEQQLFHAGYALERVHIDIMGPLVETQKGNKYILVIVDQFTLWVEAFPIKNQLAETVAGVVVREFVARFGCPLEIHTDLRPALHLP